MKKGSITVYVCLVFCVILSLIYGCINSVRVSCGRAAVSCAVEEALFSLFSTYDKELFDEYGLLLIDAGYSGSDFLIGKLAKEADETVEKILSPETGIWGTNPEKLYGINIGKPEVTGYVLATDMNYQRIREQIQEIILSKVGTDILSELGSHIGSNAEILSKYSFDDNKDMEELLEDYENDKKNAEIKKEEAAGETSQEEIQEAEIPEDFENPLDNADSIRNLGLYNFFLPEDKEVSPGKIDIDSTVSHRNKKSGMGIMPEEKHESYEKIMLSEYAIRFFSDFLSDYDKDSAGKFKYQAEYIIVGKDKDSKNLKSVLDYIILIREGMNYLYLYTDAEKMAQISEVALIVSTILLSPELEIVVQQLIMLLWAYAESLMDVKNLLAGGKVPIFKDSSTWQLSLSGICSMNSSTNAEKTDIGLGYSEYLRLLMYMQPDQIVLDRTMDMLEYNKRFTEGNEDFCLDNCISDIEIGYSGSIGKNEFYINRSYGY